jgi:hypothetical protein
MRYIEYTDDTFTTKRPQPSWLGILGPIIRGVEGDTIKVVFYNKAGPFPFVSPTHPPKSYSMHPHGLQYDKDNEGAVMHTGEGEMEEKEKMQAMQRVDLI